MEVAAAALGDHVYVIGGYKEAAVPDATTAVQIYDVSTDTWLPGPHYPVPIHHTAAVAVDDTVYVFGGYVTSGLTASPLAYRLEGETWQPIAPLPEARGAHAAVLLDGLVYLVGGLGLDMRNVATVAVYDPATDTWGRVADLPTPREHLSAAAHDGMLYVVGGRTEPVASTVVGVLQTNLGALEVFDPSTGVWQVLPSMPTPRGGIAAAVLDGELVVVGGEGKDATFEQAEAYDPASSTWRALPDMPLPRHGLGAVTVEGRMYTFLGGPGPWLTFSNVVHSLGPAPAGP